MSWRPLEISPASVGRPATVEGLVDGLTATDLTALLSAEKAVVFRGFNVTVAALDQVMDLALPNRLAYLPGERPRTRLGPAGCACVRQPAGHPIPIHQELSCAVHWPARLMFFCQIAAQSGGATPVVDAALWLESLDPEVRAAFAAGVRYQRDLPDGPNEGGSWQDAFATDSRAEAETFLAAGGATWEWTADGLRVSQRRPSTMRHPVTGVEVWFNQSDQWHADLLDDEIAGAAQSVTFADGSPIPAEFVLQVRDRGWDAAVDVDWRVGDILLVDNLLVGHGRRPYTGDRRVIVAMSD